MALNNVTFNVRQGGLGRALPGQDYISGMVVWGPAPPDWATYSPDGLPAGAIQEFFSVQDAENAGIVAYQDNDPSTCSITVGNGTTLGTIASGDTITIATPLQGPVYTYTVTAEDVADHTGDTLATSLQTAINALTYVNGYSAGINDNEVLIAGPLTYNAQLNSETLSISVNNSHTFTFTVTDFTDGTTSLWAIWAYHIEEFFRVQPQGYLYFGVFDRAHFNKFNEIQTLQQYTNGLIRQVGVYDTDETRGSIANISGTIDQIQAACNNLFRLHMPLVALYSPNIAAVDDLSKYPNQQTNTANFVSCVISQDGGGQGAALFITDNTISIGNMGCALGAVALSAVDEDIAWPQKFNMSDGSENNVPAFANGQLVNTLSAGLMDQLNSNRYIFFRQFIGTVNGSYFNDNHSCISQSNDFAYINDNRTMQKVIRILYATYVPVLNSPLILNGDGTLQDYTVEYFTDLGTNAVTAAMITGFGNSPEISAIQITIDPSQQVLENSTLEVQATVVANGVARNIVVNIGFGTI